MVEKIMEMNNPSLSVLHIGIDKWRSYVIRIDARMFREESGIDYRPHTLEKLLIPLLLKPQTLAWWKLCFTESEGNINFDDYYLDLPISDGTDKTFKQLFEEIKKELPDFPISPQNTLFITGDYTEALPVWYLLQQKYACRLNVRQKKAFSSEIPTLTLYTGPDNQCFHVGCFGRKNKKLIYFPYRPGEPNRQAYVWMEQDSMLNFYLCMELNNQETNIIPWMN